MSMETVSIIVPVYNAEAYLEQTVQSIQKQTHPDWELVLIDDGSTDGSGAICDRFAAEDARIAALHIRNEGVANARNVGLAAATGDFIAFCDSDDLYEPDFLQTLFEQQRASHADLCVASVYVDTENDSQAHPAPLTGELTEKDFRAIVHGWFDIYWMGLWNKLYRADIVRRGKVSFQTGLSIGEDSLFTLSYLAHARSVSCSEKPIYHYIQRNAQSLSRRFHADHVIGYEAIIAQLKELAVQYGCMDDALEALCLQKHSEALGSYLYLAMADANVEEATRRAAHRMLKAAPEERKLLASSGGLTNRILGTCPYFIIKLYFTLLKLRGRA